MLYIAGFCIYNLRGRADRLVLGPRHRLSLGSPAFPLCSCLQNDLCGVPPTREWEGRSQCGRRGRNSPAPPSNVTYLPLTVTTELVAPVDGISTL